VRDEKILNLEVNTTCQKSLSQWDISAPSVRVDEGWSAAPWTDTVTAWLETVSEEYNVNGKTW